MLFCKKNIEILYNSEKNIKFAHKITKDSRIRQSGSKDNRTRRHPVELLAGHLFYRQQ